MYKLVVSYANRTKKCILDVSSIEDLLDEVRNRFEIDMSIELHLQYFDREVEEFIDLDTIEDLEIDAFTRIKVITENAPLLNNINQTDASLSSTSSALSTKCTSGDRDPDLPTLIAPKKSKDAYFSSPNSTPTTSRASTPVHIRPVTPVIQCGSGDPDLPGVTKTRNGKRNGMKNGKKNGLKLNYSKRLRLYIVYCIS